MRKKLLVAVAALVLALSMPAVAFAANSAFDKGTAESSSYLDSYTGNAFLTERDALNLSVERDSYWAGDTLNASGLEIGNGTGGSALLAGATLNVASSDVHGSLRAAGQNINISGTNVGNNITVAGQDVSIASDVSACGVYAAGSNVSISGSYQSAALAGGTVSLAGSYAGDVSISAGTVRVSKGTTVAGTLRVPNGAEVAVEDGANVPNVSYVDDALVTSASQESSPSPLTMVGPLLFSCFAHILLVLLFFALPLLGLFLLFPLVTAPISVLIFLFIGVLWAFSIPFAGYVLGRCLFKKVKPLGAGMLGVVILTAVCYVPYLFFVVPTVSSIFVAGYLAQSFLDKRAAQKDEDRADSLPQGTAE